MSDLTKRRSRTAHRFTTRHRLPRPIVLVTVGFWLVYTIIAIVTPTVFQPPFSVPALGQQVQPGYQRPGFNLCGPAEMVYVGNDVPVKNTDTCSPIRWAITVPEQVNINDAAASQGPTSAPPSDHPSPVRSSDPTSTTHRNADASRGSPATAIIAARQREVTKAISTDTSSLSNWLPIWIYGIGFGECTFAAIICVAVFNFLRKHLLGAEYSPGSRALMIGATMSVWIVVGSVTMVASSGLANAKNLDAVFGTQITHLDPKPAGKIDPASVGDSIGNSIPAVYGPNAKGYCFQSPDSLANLLTKVMGIPVRNLACSAATITQGLLGPQPDGAPHWKSNAQVGYLKNQPHLRFVIVTDGQDELHWSQITGICFLADSCNNRLTAAEFQMDLKVFIVQFNNLLQRLANLSTHPHVLVNLSYDPFTTQAEITGANCPAVGSLTATDVQTIVSDNNALNHVMQVETAAYRKFGFVAVTPHLTPFCTSQLQDIEPVWNRNGTFNKYAFHPLESGEYAIAFADYPVIRGWMSQTRP